MSLYRKKLKSDRLIKVFSQDDLTFKYMEIPTQWDSDCGNLSASNFNKSSDDENMPHAGSHANVLGNNEETVDLSDGSSTEDNDAGAIRANVVMEALHTKSSCSANRNFVVDSVEPAAAKRSDVTKKSAVIFTAHKYQRSGIITSPPWQSKVGASNGGCFRQTLGNSNKMGINRINIQNSDYKCGRKNDGPIKILPASKSATQLSTPPREYKWKLGRVTSTYETFSPIGNPHDKTSSPPKPSSPPELPEQEMWTSPTTPKLPAKLPISSPVPSQEQQLSEHTEMEFMPVETGTPLNDLEASEPGCCETPLSADASNLSSYMNSSNSTDYSQGSGSISLRGPRSKIKFSLVKPVQLKNKMHDTSVPAMKFSAFSYSAKVKAQSLTAKTFTSQSDSNATAGGQVIITSSVSSASVVTCASSGLPPSSIATVSCPASSQVNQSSAIPTMSNAQTSTPGHVTSPVWNIPPPIPAASAWVSPPSTNYTPSTARNDDTTPGTSPQLQASKKPSRRSLATPSEAGNIRHRGLWHPGMDNVSPNRPSGALPYASPSMFQEDDSWMLMYKTKYMKSNIPFIDSHCHLDFLFTRMKHNGSLASYLNGADRYAKETLPGNFAGCVAIFCDPFYWKLERKWKGFLSENNVWGSFGVHPKSAEQWNQETEALLRACIKNDKVVAVGEIGLDYSKGLGVFKEKQHQAFRDQLKIAIEHSLPIVIHCRDAEQDCWDIMSELVPKDYKIHRHCFTENWACGQHWLATYPNLMLGLTPLVTFPTARATHEVARKIPLNRLLLETDSPYFIPRGVPKSSVKFSHPGMAITVAAEVSVLQGRTLDDVLKQVRLNTTTLYGI